MSGRMRATVSSPTLLDAVSELARHAGDVALQHFRTGLFVETKSDGSPVTIADHAAERAAREWLERRFPGDGMIGEEMGSVRPDAPRRWLVDPIDGTKSFVRGVPLWGTLVGVAEGHDVIAGAIYCGAAGELVSAARGEGCWWNGTRCAVSDVSSLDMATVLTTDERFPRDGVQREERRDAWRALAERSGLSRTWGDCYGYVLVATGRAEVMVDPVMAPWDSAALGPIVTEAGGVFTDWTGQATALGGSAVATNRSLARVVRELLCP
jgi:histidinol-phosphatase